METVYRVLIKDMVTGKELHYPKEYLRFGCAKRLACDLLRENTNLKITVYHTDENGTGERVINRVYSKMAPTNGQTYYDYKVYEITIHKIRAASEEDAVDLYMEQDFKADNLATKTTKVLVRPAYKKAVLATVFDGEIEPINLDTDRL